MTTTPSPGPDPRSRWYADPQGTDGLRWWDGTTWTAATRPTAGSSGSHRPSLGPGWRGLAVALQVVLVVGVLVELSWVALDLWGWTLAEGWRQDASTVDPAAARRYDTVTLGGAVMLFVTYLAGGVLFITWLFRAHRSDRMHGEQLRHGSGWAIGGWFVPILNLVRPLQMVLDLRRGASGSPASALPVAWWLTYAGQWRGDHGRDRHAARRQARRTSPTWRSGSRAWSSTGPAPRSPPSAACWRSSSSAAAPAWSRRRRSAVAEPSPRPMSPVRTAGRSTWSS